MYTKTIVKAFERNREKLIQVGDTYVCCFDTQKFLKEPATDYQFKLRLVGDQGVHPAWLCEGGYPLLYRMIDDALCTQVVHHSQFSLKLKMNYENYPKRVYYKMLFPLHITPQYKVKKGDDKHFKFSIYVKTKDLTIKSDGKVEIVFEKRFIRPGVDERDISYEADEIVKIPIQEGSYDWQKIEKYFELEENIANLLIYIVVEKSKGIVYFEDPVFETLEGHNLLPQFTMSNPYHEYLNWFGENISRKEWTDLRIKINNQVCFEGEVFQRTHIGSEQEIEIPREAIKEGANEVAIENISDYFCPFPYKLKEVQLLYRPYKRLNIISYPEVVRIEEQFAVLIDLKEKEDKVTIQSKTSKITSEQEHYFFEENGFQVVYFKVLEAGVDLPIQIILGDEVEKITIKRSVIKEEDNILTGTGDAIYIPQDVKQVETFLGWYLKYRIGKFITFRPVYRWCGTRVINPKYWERVVELCNKVQLKYCHMIDGREMPGMNANPTLKMLEGDNFIGSQGHERDGAFCYWGDARGGQNPLFDELFYRFYKHEDYQYATPPQYDDKRLYSHFTPYMSDNMEEAKKIYIQNIQMSLKNVKRHSGPTVLFKYFYEAGVENAGGELMYGPHEVILAAQRGAAKAYNKQETLAHLAVQWSTTPHDTIERYRRYQLALFMCYTQGIHHINTEEGLWRMEEYFSYYDRFDNACMMHRKVQQDFNHFILTHTRKGRMIHPIALLHGNNDGWVCFGRRSAWGYIGDEWSFSTPEESWDLIKVFYPDSVLHAIYRHPCENKIQGFYTRTPYGTVDILPIEAEVNIYKEYPAMAFLGWNTAEAIQIDKLLHYVTEGGQLLLSWCHLFTTSIRKEALEGESDLISQRYIQLLLGIKEYAFDKEDKDSHMATLTLDELTTVTTWLEGMPLVIEHKVGKGKVTFVNTCLFPADRRIRETYEKLLEDLVSKVTLSYYERGYIVVEDTVNFTIYDREDNLRTIYLLNIDWWSKEKDIAEAKLKWKEKTIPIKVARGKINILTLADRIAIYTDDNDTEVLEITENEEKIIIHLQGRGETKIQIIAPWYGIKTSEEIVAESVEGIYNLKVNLEGISHIELKKTDKNTR